MKHLSVLLTLILIASCSSFTNQPPIRIVHYNIKELDSTKINTPNPQLSYVKEVLNKLDFNILSINEIQYDIPGVPSYKFKSRGENISNLAAYLDMGLDDWSFSFHPANTGALARKKNDGSFYRDFSSKKARDYADKVNFGLFPAQYSTGALFDFKKVYEVLVKDLHWRSFNPKAKIYKYKQANGKPLPKTMELFDKTFTDVTIKIQGKKVHLILLHTVPSYHFGNKKSPNYARNADQLRFLEWYLTGKTDFKVNLEHIKPLPKGSTFIAIGDWNSDFTNKKDPGSKIIRRLMNKFTPWMNKPGITNESPGFSKKRLKLTLDYILFSDDLELVKGGVITPPENRMFMGCNKKQAKFKNIPDKRKLTYWTNKRSKKRCYVSVDKEFYNIKQASDHYPIFADLRFKENK